MRSWIKLAVNVLSCAMLLGFSASVAMAYDPEELYNTWKTDVFVSTDWSAQSVQQFFAENGFQMTAAQSQKLVDLESAGDIEGSLKYLLELFDIPPVPSNPPSIDPYRKIFDEVVLPPITTLSTKKTLAAMKARGESRVFNGVLRYAQTEIPTGLGDKDGDIVGINLGIAKDYDNATLGFILPYDHSDYDDYGDADRYGLILFGQYHMPLSEQLTASLTANLQYLYNHVDFELYSDNYSTLGGGLTGSLTYDTGPFVCTAAAGYHYDENDVDYADDHQELVKIGANVGMRFGESAAATLFGVYNLDTTDYSYDRDDEYFDVGAAFNMNLTETWNLSVGYRKVVDLDDYEADEIFLGSALMF